MNEQQPSGQSVNLKYLNARLNGMEDDVVLTPGYIEWRQQATAESQEARNARAARIERLDQRLGAAAVEKE